MKEVKKVNVSVMEHYSFNNTTNGILQENGRIMKESLLTGPNGVAKMQSVWDGDRLITVEIFKSDWKSFVKQ